MRQIVLTIAALGLCAGVAVAQDQPSQPNAPAAGTPSMQQGTQSSQPAARPARRGRSARQGSQAAQRGPQNPAIKSTDQNNASAPVAGANSFTQGQARSRIEAKGYTNVSGLKKDDSGVWRGTATLNGHTGPVSVDYQGNVN